ncbi:MAG: hypothetical protein AAGA30_16080 [Planctomycetota bacterium]
MQNNSEYWGVFFDRVLTQPPVSYEQIIQRHEFGNPAKASNALMTAKRQFNRIIEDLLAKQTYLTDESTNADLQADIDYLRHQLANSKLVGIVIESIANSDKTGGITGQTHDSAICDRLLFIDDSADANWEKSDATALIGHLLAQPSNTVAPELRFDRTLAETLGISKQGEQSLTDIHRLKQYFNQNAKTGVDALPQVINVSMTFLCIASYRLAGGDREEVTSTSCRILAERFVQMSDKSWLPTQVKAIYQRAAILLGENVEN